MATLELVKYRKKYIDMDKKVMKIQRKVLRCLLFCCNVDFFNTS